MKTNYLLIKQTLFYNHFIVLIAHGVEVVSGINHNFRIPETTTKTNAMSFLIRIAIQVVRYTLQCGIAYLLN